MLTGAQAADVMNLVETNAIAALEDDDWLKTGGTGGINQIVAKTIPGNERTVWEAILPCLIVRAPQFRPGDERTAGGYDLIVLLQVEYNAISGDVDAGMDGVQTALARLARWYEEESVTSGRRLNGLLDTGAGIVRNVAPEPLDVEQDEDDDSRFWMSGIVAADILLRAAL